MTGPDAASLERAFASVREQLTTDAEDPWAHSPYRWIRELQTRTRGKAGELIVEHWLREAGFTVTRAGSGPGDRVVNGHRVEVKLSTQWNGGGFRFSQLREQTYSHFVLVGVQPQTLRVWCPPKDVVLAHSTGQHTGASALETRWLTFPVDEPPAWLRPYGGTPREALGVAQAALADRSGACDLVGPAGLEPAPHSM